MLGHGKPNNVGAWQACRMQAWRMLFFRAGDKETFLFSSVQFLIPIRRPSCHCYIAIALPAAGCRPADPLSFPGCPSTPGTPDNIAILVKSESLENNY